MSPYVWNRVYKSELWRDITFPVGHRYEDCEISFYVFASSKKVYLLNNPLYYYRVRPGSISQTITHSHVFINDFIRFNNVISSFIKTNIPEIFTPEDYKNFLTQPLKTSMAYSMLRPKGMSLEEWKLARESLSRHVAELGEKIGLENCSLLLRVAYWMFWHCRGLLTVIYRYAWAPVRVAKRCWQIIKG